MKVSLNAFAGRLFEIVKNKTMNLENIFPRQMPDLSSLKLINEYMYHFFFINLNKYMKGFNFYYMHVYVQSYNANIIIKSC